MRFNCRNLAVEGLGALCITALVGCSGSPSGSAPCPDVLPASDAADAATCKSCQQPNYVCEDGEWVCAPSCDARQCGSDGCGGSCGTCPAGKACLSGTCGNMPPWARRFGGAADDRAQALAVDPDGNIYLAGFFASAAIDLGGGPLVNAYPGWRDMFLGKLDAAGNHLWSKRFGGDNAEHASAMALAEDRGVYVAGIYSTPDFDLGGGPLPCPVACVSGQGGPVFLARFEPDGRHSWSHSFDMTGEAWITAMHALPAGGVCAVGYFKKELSLGGDTLSSMNSLDAFVACFDPLGSHLWSVGFGSPSHDDWARGIDIDAESSLVVAGALGGQVSHVGDTRFEPLTYGAFALRFDAAGSLIWARSFQGMAGGVALDTAGRAYLAGASQEVPVDAPGFDRFPGEANTNAWVMALDADGGERWALHFGGTYQDIGWGVLVDQADNVFTYGTFQSLTMDIGTTKLETRGLRNIYLARLDDEGNPLWAEAYGSSMVDGPAGLAEAPGNALIIAGWFDGADIVLDGHPLYNAHSSSADIFVARTGK